jgi:hypothetical protein
VAPVTPLKFPGVRSRIPSSRPSGQVGRSTGKREESKGPMNLIIGRTLLDVVDDHHIEGQLARLQPQPELLHGVFKG